MTSTLAGLAASPAPAAAGAASCTLFGTGVPHLTICSFTGGPQLFTVPAGVTSITIEAYGAEGERSAATADAAGGLGGRVDATVGVTPGEDLQVNVGGEGRAHFGGNGFNGGAAGGDGDGAFDGGRGGGGSDVRRNSPTFGLDDRVVVAGGGGGGGEGEAFSPPGPPGGGFERVGTGGAGGGVETGDGVTPLLGGFGGQGGANGGLGGDGCRNAEGGDGTPGQGGTGGGLADIGGGGGGGGYLGGGGGESGRVRPECTAPAGGGGGGGSSFAIPGATGACGGGGTDPCFTPGVREGNGEVRLTYMVVPPPTVTGISPVEGPVAGGTVVTITGTGFNGADRVRFGSTSIASFTVDSDTQITATAPPRPPGPVSVKVRTPSGLSAATGAGIFHYWGAPAVTKVAPIAGPSAGGNTVSITGASFAGVTDVRFGVTPSTSFVVESPSKVRAVAPAAAAGTVDVVVTTAFGTSAGSGADDYAYFDVPTVTGISPNQGTTAGGTTVVITGTGFTGTNLVRFASTPATFFTVDSDTQITATAPPHTADLVRVRVRSPGGTSAGIPSSFYRYIS